jgi:catechol 2,3-dioxygenase-like lactoylglutathione lyase family enzyme
MSEAESKTTTRIREVRTIGIPVSDQEKALDFYRDKLGFEKRLDAPFGQGQRWLEVAPPGGATTIALVPAREGYAAGIDTGIRLITSDAEADHSHLQAAGVDADQEIMKFPVPMFSFRDADGNRLIIVEQS